MGITSKMFFNKNPISADDIAREEEGLWSPL
jgi:hypothetical protein